jgi:hypothetical protein
VVGAVPASEKYELSVASAVAGAALRATVTVICGFVALPETVVVTVYERLSGASGPDTVWVPAYGFGKPE